MDNHCKRWKDEDIKYIFEQMKKNVDIETISLELKRKSLAVNSKMYQIINLMINIVGIFGLV